MADCVCYLARAAREASGGRRLVVFFYGYVFEFGAIHNGPATSGHYALRRVLDCPDIDVLCSPSDSLATRLSYCDYYSGNHTGQNVPVYAVGVGAEDVVGTIDNTDVYSVTAGFGL